MISELGNRLALSILVLAGYVVALMVLDERELLAVPTVLMLMVAAVLVVGRI